MTDPPVPSAVPDDLDGHTLEELSDYLDRGRTPLDPSIEMSPACRIALAGLERLRALAGPLLQLDAESAPADDRWMDRVLSRISLESRSGRRFPLVDLPTDADAVVTEGALRGLVRAIGDSVPGLLTGRVRFRVDEESSVVDLEVDVHVVYGTPIDEAVAELRRRVAALLPLHAPFAVRALDVHVRDVLDDHAGEP